MREVRLTAERVAELTELSRRKIVETGMEHTMSRADAIKKALEHCAEAFIETTDDELIEFADGKLARVLALGGSWSAYPGSLLELTAIKALGLIGDYLDNSEGAWAPSTAGDCLDCGHPLARGDSKPCTYHELIRALAPR